MNTTRARQSHIPVMLKEVLSYLAPQPAERFLDCTFGAGGYSAAILSTDCCEVVGVDRDPTVLPFVVNLTNKYQERFRFLNASFLEIKEQLKEIKFHGIVMDLGVSMMQLADPARGFSFMLDGPLDMRMSNCGLMVADVINSATEQELADIIYRYGDEFLARKIAKSIIFNRAIAPIKTTLALAQIVRQAIGFRKSKIDPATKTFQALRIFINDELTQLEEFLKAISSMLLPQGRLVIVSFHALEDTIVKNFFKANYAKVAAKSKYAKQQTEFAPGKWLKILTKKPMTPSLEELKLNPSARSAKLRAAVKIKLC